MSSIIPDDSITMRDLANAACLVRAAERELLALDRELPSINRQHWSESDHRRYDRARRNLRRMQQHFEETVEAYFPVWEKRQAEAAAKPAETATAPAPVAEGNESSDEVKLSPDSAATEPVPPPTTATAAPPRAKRPARTKANGKQKSK